ncbi:hypothetical protein ACLOJK_037058, partial [Asimina triloba]
LRGLGVGRGGRRGPSTIGEDADRLFPCPDPSARGAPPHGRGAVLDRPRAHGRGSMLGRPDPCGVPVSPGPCDRCPAAVEAQCSTAPIHACCSPDAVEAHPSADPHRREVLILLEEAERSMRTTRSGLNARPSRSASSPARGSPRRAVQAEAQGRVIPFRPPARTMHHVLSSAPIRAHGAPGRVEAQCSTDPTCPLSIPSAMPVTVEAVPSHVPVGLGASVVPVRATSPAPRSPRHDPCGLFRT